MANRLSKIATRTGDTGTSGLADGTRLPKHHPRFAAMGDVDELGAVIGQLLGLGIANRLAEPLKPIQHALFNLGGSLAMPGHAILTEEHVTHLDQALESLNADLPPLREFVLPIGPMAVTTAHLARAVCRRAERSLWALLEAETGEPDAADQIAAAYLNRLSDLLFVIARHLSRQANPDEAQWQA